MKRILAVALAALAAVALYGTTNLDCVNILNAPALKRLRTRLGR